MTAKPERVREMLESAKEDSFLTAGEVALLFRVDPKTVVRWANDGKISAVRTLGGHRRFRSSEVMELLTKKEESE